MLARRMIAPARALSSGARTTLLRPKALPRVEMQQRNLPQINLCTFTIFCAVAFFSIPWEY